MNSRIKKCTKKINDNNLDGVLFATGANFQYVSNCYEYFWQRASMHNIGGRHSAKLLPETLAYLNKLGEVTIITIPQYRNMFPNCKVVVSYMDQFEDTLSKVIDGINIGIGHDCNEHLKELLKEVNPDI